MHNSIDTSVKVCLDTFVSNDFDCSFMLVVHRWRQFRQVHTTYRGLYAELKQTVEAVFSHMPQKGPEKILWLVFINYVTYVSEYICNFSNLILESL